jgi:hypothetical protein
VGETELQEWVKAGIKKDQVINYLATTICHHDIAVQPTFEQIFAHVRGYLTFLGPDKDPYRVAKGSNCPISANKAKVVTPDKNENDKNRKGVRCTRCWYKGHRWKVCKSPECNVCTTHLPTDAKFCPNWESHTEPGTRWTHPSFHKKSGVSDKSSGDGNPGNNQGADTETPQLKAARQALKQARKFLKATVKEAKKQKP